MTTSPAPPMTAAPVPRRFEWTCVRADALAWETLPTDLVGLRFVAYVLWLALAFVWPLLVPESWGIDDRFDLFFGVLALAGATHFAVAEAFARWRRRRRAAKRCPGPVAMWLEDRGDRLVYGPVGGAPRVVTPDRIRQVVVTDRHAMIDAPPEVLILPLAAFADAADLRAWADAWDRLSEDAVP